MQLAPLHHGLPVKMYNEAHTSQEAELNVEASRGARGLGLNRSGGGGGGGGAAAAVGAHLDDVAAAILLERYFAQRHGPPVDIPPRLGLGPPELGRGYRGGGQREKGGDKGSSKEEE
jgi:hypothetical protein